MTIAQAILARSKDEEPRVQAYDAYVLAEAHKATEEHKYNDNSTHITFDDGSALKFSENKVELLNTEEN